MKIRDALRLLLLVWMLSGSLAVAQPADSALIVTFRELSFHSDYERTSFNQILQPGSDCFFDLFLSFDPEVTRESAEEYQERLGSLTAQYHAASYQKLADKKKLQKIYSSVHKEMLDKYMPEQPFSSIFMDGEYHCVSSSMLYALVFDDLKIPYEIRLMPNHVYLVAFPSALHMVVETTDPLKGTIVYDQVFKAKFAEYLRNAKLISKQEYNTKTVDKLFEEYFNKTKTIDKRQLGSLQYHNQAITSIQKEDYTAASRMMEKAYVLNPDTLNTYLLFVSWLLEYNGIDKSSVASAEHLGKLSRFLGKGLTSDELVGEFAMITQKQLLYEGDEERFDSSFQRLMSNVADSALAGEFSFLYHYERGRILCNKREFREAIPFTTEAFLLKPKNVDAKNNLLLAINNSLEAVAPSDRLALVNQVAEEVPALLEDKLFAQLRLSMYLMMVHYSFSDGNAKDGDSYRERFEQLYPEPISAYQYLDGDIETAYGTAASYYFRLGQLKRSRAVLEKGLQYVPDSYELKIRMNAVR